ncbi:PREDICTED: gamma-tubulin complex component 6 [Dufourea novaeangliae]|uniref:gamma-tubulin complex component 6 n=1 Tax=Dufourea novaeangliae TaxID=178035 RepID=UPI000767A93E|nr:PREDICTED: gamma-tubulin complex component 6 [Dufourea novaeangliae]
MNSDDDVDVYGLITDLSRHLLQTYRQPFRRNAQFIYDHDNKTVKFLRSKAFEILLKKADGKALKQDYMDHEQIDPILEIQKHVFIMKLGLMRSGDPVALERLLGDLEESSCSNASIYSVLQLLVCLKNFNVTPEPITNIFYYGKANPAVPEITYTTSNAQCFQPFPMECFILSNKFEATLETQRLQVMHALPAAITNELHLLHGTVKSSGTIGTESADISITSDFTSAHVFDTVSSQALIFSNQYFMKNLNLDSYFSQEVLTCGNDNESKYSFSSEKSLVAKYSYLPFSCSEAIALEDEILIDGWKSSDHSVIEELNFPTECQNYEWNDIDHINNVSVSHRRTWERLGEIQPPKERMFLTDIPTASIHLAKIKQMNSLSLLSRKMINTVLLLEEISVRNFVGDLKSMLLGIESNTFDYMHVKGFTLRKNISVHGVCSQSLQKACQEAINWGNCFRFLSDFIMPQIQTGKLLQEGLIFKAVCTSIKELLLYYRATLVRIFNHENTSERLLKTFQRVRPVARLITKVAKLCKPYKENECTLPEGSSILTRIYNEAIQVTDTKVALVFYFLLKSCCDVYFRFLQKWMFEGVCDDIYGEFMIKTRSQYLRNRDHKFWTKSFSVRNEAIPGFLSSLAESILQCGKTVRLLRICDTKNPVCRVCMTEQPELKVCLSVTTLCEQSSRYRKYEQKGKAALGPTLSLSTAILQQKQLEKEMAEFVIRAQHDTLLRIRREREDALKKIAQTKRDFFTKNSRHVERTNILNYYENLAIEIDNRCMRSKWRAKRMAFFEKRIDVLASMNRNSQDQLKVIEQVRPVLGSSPSTPISFEDENKNYARASYQTFVGNAFASTTATIFQAGQEDLRRSRLTDYTDTALNNNNEDSNFCVVDPLNNQRVKDSKGETMSKLPRSVTPTRVIIATDADRLYATVPSTNKKLDNILNSKPDHCAVRTATIERPTVLNVVKIDNSTIESGVRKNVWSLEGNMTPNNNELNVEKIKITFDASDMTCSVADSAEDTGNPNERNDLETPMSCTTDNFPSSVQSPVSQTHNSEDRSPIEISSIEMLSTSSRTFTKSPAAIKQDATFSDIFALQQDEPAPIVLPATASNLTVSDVELIDHTSLQAYLEKSIRVPLEVQSRLVNNAVIKYFLKENNLLLHLHSLRSYFFLLNGEFSKSLTDALYTRLYEISIPVELFNSATLTNLLERALVNSFNNVYVNSELLGLSATNPPTQLHMSDPAALDCLSLNYKIIWPLNIILDDAVMQQYGKVFKFLITSGRVSWVLQEDFSIMKRERKALTSQQYHKLQLYRHSMTQFMNALHNYLTCSVLYASWTEFEKDLEHSLTVDQIYLSHVNYIKRILSRCMLNARGEKVRVCLNNIFKVILKFHNRLRSHSWTMKSTGYVHPNFKRLEQMYQAFCELRAYMAHVAFKLATSGYQPHLMHFLNALNINHMYDLTVKTYRGSSTGPSEL